MFWIISTIVVLIITYLFVEKILRSITVGKYNEKYVFITGCDSGFGQGLACRLDNLGFHVFAGCLTEKGRKYLIEQCSNRLVALQLDVTKNQSIMAALQEVTRLLPENTGLWGLVNNAGILGNFGFSELVTREEYYQVFDVNLFGLIEMTRHFLPLIRKARGRVVNTSSVVGRLAMVGGAYGISKHGVEAYSDILRREFYLRGVKVIILEPGGFRTPLTDFDNFLVKLTARFYEQATDEMKKSYGDVQSILNIMVTSKFNHVSSDISPVIAAYTHALTARFPKTRYSVGFVAKLFFIPFSYLPTCISDPLLALPYIRERN